MKLLRDSRCRLGFHFSLLLFLHFHIAACRNKGEASASKPQLSPYIIGEEAPEGRFPYVCSLSRREDKLHRCGGFLIRPQWVVTAAHCVDPSLDSLGRNPLVRCGIHKFDAHESDKVFSGEESYWPDLWTGNVEDGYDIAVVKLNKETNLTLPSIDTQGGEFRSGKLFTALGWGLNQTGKHPNSLQMADSLIYVKNRSCKEFLGDAIKKHSICAGFSNENTCKGLMFGSITLCQAFFAEGDSGGPLLIPDRLGGIVAAGNPEFDLLVGVTSMGSEDCTDASPTIYTSIGAFWEWIQERIGENPKKKDRHNPVERPSSDGKKRVRTPKKKRPIDKKTRKEKSKKRKIEDERKRLTELSQKELLKKAYRSIKDDNALTLEAALQEDLNPDSVYVSMVQMPGYVRQDRFALLHWSVFHNASKCTEVVWFSESTLDYRVLLEYGASVDITNSNKETPLHVAAIRGHTEVAKILLDHGAKANAVNDIGQIPLHLAAHYGYSEIVQVLIDHGAKVNKVDDNGGTPLSMAEWSAEGETVEILLENGARVDTVDYNGWTPLQVAMFSDPEIVEILLKYGAKADVVDEDGDTLLHIAATHGQSEAAELLLEEDVNVDAVNKYGRTPLHNSAWNGELETAKILLDAGASKTIADNNGRTPFNVICLGVIPDCPISKRTSLERLLSP